MIQDLSAYMTQLERMRDIALTRLFPGHGPTIENPHEVIDHYIDHRREREEQILGAIRTGRGTVGDIVQLVYSDVDTELHPLAAFSVGAHVRKLVDDGKVEFSETEDLWDGIVHLITT
jgi:glyoxylase-like metal-dependent hydrolase (beta-lactamase superfamily II)